MTESYQKHHSLRAFLHTYYLDKFHLDAELENCDTVIRNTHRCLDSLLKAFGVDKNLFKQSPKVRTFYVTSEAADLFAYLLDIGEKREYGRPFNPKKLDKDSAVYVRTLLLKALLSYPSRKNVMRTICNYDKATGFYKKIRQHNLEQYLRRQAKLYLHPAVKREVKPTNGFDILTEFSTIGAYFEDFDSEKVLEAYSRYFEESFRSISEFDYYWYKGRYHFSY